MCSYRYFLYVAYMGKSFRGSQRQISRLLPNDDPLTIQGRLEMGLKLLKPTNEPIVIMSSRTDAGVNAFGSTCHVDLTRSNEIGFEPTTITSCLNRYFQKQEIPIRILKTYNIPNTFHCRSNAISRTYMYRIMIAPANSKTKSSHLLNHIPIEELNRCLFLSADMFDIEKMKEGAKLLEGYHDFRSFMGKNTDTSYKLTRRMVEYIKIKEVGKTGYSSYSWPDFTNPEDYLYLDVYMKSKGFLYRQVRRSVAALLALALGKIEIRDIKLMLEVPSRYSWCPQIKTLPAHGLYLCKVEYRKEDLDTFRTELPLSK